MKMLSTIITRSITNRKDVSANYLLQLGAGQLPTNFKRFNWSLIAVSLAGDWKEQDHKLPGENSVGIVLVIFHVAMMSVTMGHIGF